MASKLQLTLALIKPHLVKDPFALKDVRRAIVESNFFIVRSQRKRFTPEIAKSFYKEHQGKFFYKRLITLMTSGPSDMYILGHVNAIKKWRELMGPTKVFKAYYDAPNSIRGKYGLSDTRNCCHGSDSMESFQQEAKILFPDFNVDLWYLQQEQFYNSCTCSFNEEKFVHVVKNAC